MQRTAAKRTRTRRTARAVHRTVTIVAAAGLTIAACGGDDDDADAEVTDPPASETTAAVPASTAAPEATEPAPTDAAPADTDAPAATDTTEGQSSEPLVSLADTDLGQVIVAADGLTLYLFAPDADGTPTCTGACAGTWPPYLVDGGAELSSGDGLDPSLLSVVAHPDGGDMLKYGEWPLYYYAGDAAPGDVNGQGVNDVWWVVDSAGAPIQDAGFTAEEPDAAFYDY